MTKVNKEAKPQVKKSNTKDLDTVLMGYVSLLVFAVASFRGIQLELADNPDLGYAVGAVFTLFCLHSIYRLIRK